ncbi:peptidase M50 [Mycolicibacterium sp. P9-64]|uniref:peptidase M50 n=1 Tax=Mycolicibacterium sp. P9-64 TaxID=2024612 RepID=UPI0011EC08FA|nr:peptidase M50 [Mycolicibacterium sp. P9-64]KAA0086768.1 peptidase M50 [Mycolicibacterium sp. P9-64]
MSAEVVVLRFGARRVPRALSGLPVHDVEAPTDVDPQVEAGRLIVVGGLADLATVLTRLLRADRLDVEVGHVSRPWHARRARTGAARRVPLIRDETGTVVTGVAYWLPTDEDARTISGEGVVDDVVLFDGEVTGVRVEPTADMPGLRASVLTGRMRPRTWVTGRAAQLGTTGALVVRDGVAAPRPVRRSTFYRHTKGWLAVR